MKRHISYISLVFLLVSNFTFIHSANAEKIGATCKKVNAKSWSGNTPIICKKNSKGKLVWTKFGSTPTPEVTYKLEVKFEEAYETKNSADPTAVSICNSGGYRFPDIDKQSVFEIRDGSGKVMATSFLGEAKVFDGEPYYKGWNTGYHEHPSNCVFNFVLKVKKSDFYDIRLSDRLESALSFDYLVSENWKLELTLGYG